MAQAGSYPAKTTPVSGDEILLIDSAASDAIKTVTLANLLANTDTTTTFTPQLKFGGAAVGMTGTFNGRYFKFGKLVVFNIYVELTAKGSSTGNASIDLPFTVNASVTTYCVADHRSMNASYVQVGLIPSLGAASGSVRGATAAAASLSTLTDAAFANNSVLILGGAYFTT
jgi:hypothetical protein